MDAKSQSNGHGPSFSNGPGGPPVTITGVQLGRPGDDRFGG
jgi:hypothetical protein